MTASAFGALTPLIAPRSIAVIGASDREGNLGGRAVGFLRKFGYGGSVWPVNATRATVGDLPCFASVRALPAAPDLAIVAVPAEGVLEVVRDCVDAGVQSAIVWAGGFAEAGAEGAARQSELAAVARAGDLKLCGPNCIGVINTGLGMTASFSTMLVENRELVPGALSMVSQSGGLAVMAHARAQAFGLGFRVTASVGNEAVLGIADFVHALVDDDGTRVIAVYAEGLADPDAFVAALAAARAKAKPVVVLKGGTSEAAGRAALAHTGRLAGSGRTFDAICREFAVIRVHSTEELLDVGLSLASLRRDQLPAGARVLVSTFGGGSGVVCTDQCERAGLAVPVLSAHAQATLGPLVTPLSSVANPVDFTPGMMTTAAHRATMPAALDVLADLPDVDAWLFLAAGFDKLAPEVVELYDRARTRSARPMLLTWQAMPAGTPQALAARGIYAFDEHARAVRALTHIVGYATALRSRVRQVPATEAFAWHAHVPVDDAPRVIPEHRVAALLAAAGLPVAPGRCATSTADAQDAAREVGFPVALKALSPAITHRAAAGLVALDVASEDAVAAIDRRFRARAAELGADLDGVWVQHMFTGNRELLVTALRDAEFGVLIGVGVGGGATELIDDVVFARAPLASDGAHDLIGELRTLRRTPSWLPERQRALAADFVARFSALAATAPWPRFTLEVNPVKLGPDATAAVDGLLVIG